MKLIAKTAFVLPASIAITAFSSFSSLAATPTWVTTPLTRNEGSYTVFNHTSNQSDWVYATQATVNPFGTAIGDSRRKTLSNATGEPQFAYDANNTPYFLSLGVGGRGFFDFGTLFLPEVTVWETTDGNKNQQSDFDEQIEVYVAPDVLTQQLTDNSVWTKLGTIKNIADGAYNNIYGATIKSNDPNIANSQFRYVKLIDISPSKLGVDGFDVNAIAVKGVPEPNSIIGLLTFVGLGASRICKFKQKQV